MEPEQQIINYTLLSGATLITSDSGPLSRETLRSTLTKYFGSPVACFTENVVDPRHRSITVFSPTVSRSDHLDVPITVENGGCSGVNTFVPSGTTIQKLLASYNPYSTFYFWNGPFAIAEVCDIDTVKEDLTVTSISVRIAPPVPRQAPKPARAPPAGTPPPLPGS